MTSQLRCDLLTTGSKVPGGRSYHQWWSMSATPSSMACCYPRYCPVLIFLPWVRVLRIAARWFTYYALAAYMLNQYHEHHNDSKWDLERRHVMRVVDVIISFFLTVNTLSLLFIICIIIENISHFQINCQVVKSWCYPPWFYYYCR